MVKKLTATRVSLGRTRTSPEMMASNRDIVDVFMSKLEFVAEDETIEIVTNFSMPVLRMMGGDFGPFQAQHPIRVPIWLAVALHKRRKCRIRPPSWMEIQSLQRVLEEERESEGEFQPVPFRYIEVAQILFRECRDDETWDGRENLFRIRSLVEDIRMIRLHKIQTGLKRLERSALKISLDNLSGMEVNLIRPFLTKALNRYYQIEQKIESGPAPPTTPIMEDTSPTARGATPTTGAGQAHPARTLRRT